MCKSIYYGVRVNGVQVHLCVSGVLFVRTRARLHERAYAAVKACACYPESHIPQALNPKLFNPKP